MENGGRPYVQAQRDRITEIRVKLAARIAEAEREGRSGEVEGLKISLAGAEDKLAQIDSRPTSTTIELGMPTIKRTDERLKV